MIPDDSVRRRRVLQAAGAALAAATSATAGCVGSGPGSDSGSGDGQGGKRLALGGKTAAWVGQAPGDIEGKRNPTLTLTAGTTYELTWENLDGMEHELVVQDADGKELKASKSSEKKGETVTFTFDATEEMAEYYCEYHPERMRGQVEVTK